MSLLTHYPQQGIKKNPKDKTKIPPGKKSFIKEINYHLMDEYVYYMDCKHSEIANSYYKELF